VEIECCFTSIKRNQVGRRKAPEVSLFEKKRKVFHCCGLNVPEGVDETPSSHNPIYTNHVNTNHQLFKIKNNLL